jgi:hypothetical protein
VHSNGASEGASLRKTPVLLENMKLVWKGLHKVEVNNTESSDLKSRLMWIQLIPVIQMTRNLSLDYCKSRAIAPPIRQ